MGTGRKGLFLGGPCGTAWGTDMAGEKRTLVGPDPQARGAQTMTLYWPVTTAHG